MGQRDVIGLLASQMKGITKRKPLHSCGRVQVQLKDPVPYEVTNDRNATFLQVRALHGSSLQSSPTYVSSTFNKSYCMLIECQWSKENIFVKD